MTDPLEEAIKGCRIPFLNYLSAILTPHIGGCGWQIRDDDGNELARGESDDWESASVESRLKLIEIFKR